MNHRPHCERSRRATSSPLPQARASVPRQPQTEPRAARRASPVRREAEERIRPSQSRSAHPRDVLDLELQIQQPPHRPILPLAEKSDPQPQPETICFESSQSCDANPRSRLTKKPCQTDEGTGFCGWFVGLRSWGRSLPWWRSCHVDGWQEQLFLDTDPIFRRAAQRASSRSVDLRPAPSSPQHERSRLSGETQLTNLRGEARGHRDLPLCT